MLRLEPLLLSSPFCCVEWLEGWGLLEVRVVLVVMVLMMVVMVVSLQSFVISAFCLSTNMVTETKKNS